MFIAPSLPSDPTALTPLPPLPDPQPNPFLAIGLSLIAAPVFPLPRAAPRSIRHGGRRKGRPNKRSSVSSMSGAHTLSILSCLSEWA